MNPEQRLDLASVMMKGHISMEVCVPAEWSDEQVLEFAEKQNHCRTASGWTIRSECDRSISEAKDRVQCVTRKDYVHIMLDS